jgi:hypothetical protein
LLLQEFRRRGVSPAQALSMAKRHFEGAKPELSLTACNTSVSLVISSMSIGARMEACLHCSFGVHTPYHHENLLSIGGAYPSIRHYENISIHTLQSVNVDCKSRYKLFFHCIQYFTDIDLRQSSFPSSGDEFRMTACLTEDTPLQCVTYER